MVLWNGPRLVGVGAIILTKGARGTFPLLYTYDYNPLFTTFRCRTFPHRSRTSVAECVLLTEIANPLLRISKSANGDISNLLSVNPSPRVEILHCYKSESDRPCNARIDRDSGELG